MKVASNRVEHICDLYYTELSELYDSNEIDALLQLTFEFYLGFRRQDLKLRQKENVNQSDLLKLYDCCMRLKTGEPLQYILNEAWFMGLKFYVDKRVLIPRPETEELVDWVLQQKEKKLDVLDIGTGSGCIPISLKFKLPDSEVWACDVSSDALLVARKNSEMNHTKVSFLNANVLDTDVFVQQFAHDFDVIVSNPPYIKADEKESLHKNVVDYEPHLALFVDDKDEIVFYKKIIDVCEKKLRSKGNLYFELNPFTKADVVNYAEEKGYFDSIEVKNDISGKARLFRAMKK